jgi:hypothetical protein
MLNFATDDCSTITSMGNVNLILINDSGATKAQYKTPKNVI